MNKLKHNEIKAAREKQLLEQDSVCPLCGTEILPEEAVLDHDHDTGHVRMVLHRSCNQAEGRILSWIKRCRAQDPRQFLFNIISYISHDWTKNPVHPNYKTEQEREIQKLKKKLKKLKSKKAIERTRSKIEKLEEDLDEAEDFS